MIINRTSDYKKYMSTHTPLHRQCIDVSHIRHIIQEIHNTLLVLHHKQEKCKLPSFETQNKKHIEINKISELIQHRLNDLIQCIRSIHTGSSTMDTRVQEYMYKKYKTLMVQLRQTRQHFLYYKCQVEGGGGSTSSPRSGSMSTRSGSSMCSTKSGSSMCSTSSMSSTSSGSMSSSITSSTGMCDDTTDTTHHTHDTTHHTHDTTHQTYDTTHQTYDNESIDEIKRNIYEISNLILDIKTVVHKGQVYVDRLDVVYDYTSSHIDNINYELEVMRNKHKGIKNKIVYVLCVLVSVLLVLSVMKYNRRSV